MVRSWTIDLFSFVLLQCWLTNNVRKKKKKEITTCAFQGGLALFVSLCWNEPFGHSVSTQPKLALTYVASYLALPIGSRSKIVYCHYVHIMKFPFEVVLKISKNFLFIVCLLSSSNNSWCSSTTTGEEGSVLLKRFGSFDKLQCESTGMCNVLARELFDIFGIHVILTWPRIFMVAPCNVTVGLSQSTFLDSASCILYLIAVDIKVLVVRLQSAELTHGPLSQGWQTDSGGGCHVKRDAIKSVCVSVQPCVGLFWKSARCTRHGDKEKGRQDGRNSNENWVKLLHGEILRESVDNVSSPFYKNRSVIS